MNSLQELNGYGSTSVDFNDQAQYVVEFNKSLDSVTGTTINVNEDTAFLQPAQVVVTTLTSPPNDIVIEVDLSATEYAPRRYGATLVNTGSNENIIISRLRNGKVVINGIRTKADWDAVFNDVKVQLQADFNTNFTYTTKVFDNLTFFVEWSNTVNITDLVDFAAPNSFVYNEEESLTLSGFQITDTEENKTYRVSVTIDDSSAGVLSIGSESGTSVTVTGSKTEVNNLLTSLTYFPTIDYTDNFNLTYVQEQITDGADNPQANVTIPVTIGQTNGGIVLPDSITIPKNSSTTLNFQISDLANNIDPNTEYFLGIEPSSIINNLNSGYRGNYTLSNQSYTSNDALDTYNLDVSNYPEFSPIDFGGVFGPLLPQEDFNDQFLRYSIEKYKIQQTDLDSQNKTYELRLELDKLVGQFYWIPSGFQSYANSISMTLTGTKEQINNILDSAYFRHFNFDQRPAILNYYLSRTDDTTGQTEIVYDFTRKVYPPLFDSSGDQISSEIIGKFFSSYSSQQGDSFLNITGTKQQIEDALQNDVVFELIEDYEFSANIKVTFKRLGEFPRTFVEDVDVPVVITPAFLGQEYKGGYYAGEVSYDLNNDATHYLIVQKREDVYQGVIDEKNNGYAGINRGPTDQLITDTIPTSWNCGQITNTDNNIYGFPNTENLLQSNCVNNGFTELAKVIAYRGAQGYPDFYIPATKELEHVYTKFKPTSSNNETSVGNNFLTVPSRTTNYTFTDPSQTTVSEFVGQLDGGPNEIDNQAYYTNVDPNTQAGRFHYWTSTDTVVTGDIAPNLIDFRNGNVVTDYEAGSSAYLGYIRYIRREPKP